MHMHVVMQCDNEQQTVAGCTMYGSDAQNARLVDATLQIPSSKFDWPLQYI